MTEQIRQILQRIADGFVNQPRAPIMRTPAEVGLGYEDVIEKQLLLAGVPADWIDDGLMADLSRRMVLTTSIGLERRNPQEWARNVHIPTFLYQVHDDVLTDPTDVETMFESIPITEKELHWVHGTTRRWDGYLEFQRHPEPILGWFASYMC